MSATLWQHISTGDLDQAVDQTFLMLADAHAPASPCAEDAGTHDMLMGVYCEEQQQCALVVRCAPPLAGVLASRMLELPPDALAEADLVDALGEVVNVIAGTVRGLMEKPGAMSTPFRMEHAEIAALKRYDQRTYVVDEQVLTLYRI